jgi:protein-tyrosine phosphatase
MITDTPFARLFLGGIRDAIRLSSSNTLQIKTVIDVSMDKAEPRGVGIMYVHIPLPDGEPVVPWVLERALVAIARHIRTGRLLVHCGAGMSRSVAIASLYLHVVGYADYREALAAIAKSREVDVSPAMQRSVERYLENLARKGSNENSHSRRSSG